MRSRFVPAVLALSMAFASAPTFAAPAPKGAPPGYETVWNDVVSAEKSEEYERALTLLDSIPSAKQNAYTKLKRSALLVRIGRFVEAEELLSLLLKDPAADALRATVQGDLDDLRARMPKLTVRMAKGSAPDAWVTLDGKPIGPPVTVPLDPGTHQLSASRGGKEVFKQKVTLQDSQVLEVEIDTSVVPPDPPVAHVSVPPAQPAPAQPAPAVAKPAEPKDSGTVSSSPFGRAWPAFAVGALFAGGSIASFLLAKSAQTSVKDECASQIRFGCDKDAAGASRVGTWQTMGWISGGLALGAVGVGVVLMASGKEKTGATARVSPMVGTTSGLSFEGSF